MPCRPNDERAHRYADLLPPDASPEDITVVAHLHRALATPEPPPHLAVRLRHLARTLPDRRIAARHASARRGAESGREPSLELPEATTWSYPHEPRLTPFRAAAAFLVAATLLLFLVLSFHALLPLAPERPATVTDPAAIPAAPLARSVLTANELRTRLGYQLFVPSPPPPGLVPVYQLAGPDRDAPVSITFFTPDGHTAFVLRQAPADRSPLPDGGEPVPLPDGTVVHAFASSPSADGRPTLEWVQQGTHVVLIAGTYSRTELLSIAGSLSPHADLVLLDSLLSRTTLSTPTPSTLPRRPLPGHLAVALGNRLLIAGQLVIEDGGVSTPAWSSSGTWIAYRKDVRDAAIVVVQRVSGEDRFESVLPDGHAEPPFAWSPTRDELALRSADGGLVLLVPGEPSHARPILSSRVGSFAWAPDGRAIAAVRRGDPARGEPDELTIVQLVDGRTRVVARSLTAQLVIAGWWPDGRGLLYWDIPSASPSLAADGVPLRSLDLTTGATATLATMVPDPGLIAWGPSTQDPPTAILAAGEGRAWWAATKDLLHCDLRSGRCEPLPTGSEDTAALLPSWRPTGGPVAFIAAPIRSHAPLDRDELTAWIAGHRLVIVYPDGTPAVEIPPDLQRGVLEARWVDEHALLVLHVPEPGRPRLVWFEVSSGRLWDVADLTGYLPDPPLDGYGTPAVRLDRFAAWRAHDSTDGPATSAW